MRWKIEDSIISWACSLGYRMKSNFTGAMMLSQQLETSRKCTALGRYLYLKEQ
jgi:hypothetical protein